MLSFAIIVILKTVFTLNEKWMSKNIVVYYLTFHKVIGSPRRGHGTILGLIIKRLRTTALALRNFR